MSLKIWVALLFTLHYKPCLILTPRVWSTSITYSTECQRFESRLYPLRFIRTVHLSLYKFADISVWLILYCTVLLLTSIRERRTNPLTPQSPWASLDVISARNKKEWRGVGSCRGATGSQLLGWVERHPSPLLATTFWKSAFLEVSWRRRDKNAQVT